MQLNGAEIVIRCLQEEGVEYVFGYPGGAVLFLYDELFKQNKVQHVLARHEQGAVHAADGYARSTEKVGVALVTSGPGVTNAVTGIATAYMDSIPLVIITGQVPTHAIGQDAFQECDTVGITRPCVKHNFLVKDVKDIASTIKKAFYIAATGRPGPVVVDIPKDITTQKADFEYPKTIAMRSYNPVVKGHAGQIKKAIQMLMGAKRPMIYTGGGIVLGEAAAELAQLVHLAIAVSQLRMRGILRRRNHQLVFRMWLFPWLTWLVIGIISFILAVMFIMPTHRVEVSSTLALTVIIILLSQTGRRSSHSRPVPIRRAARG